MERGDQLGEPVLSSGAGDYYVGTPALAGDPQQKASVLALRADGHVGRGTLGSTGSWSWADKLGLFPHPVTAVQVASKAMAVFGVDEDGSLWLSESLWKANSSGVNVPLTALGGWRKLSAPAGGALTGEISSIALASGSEAAVVARAADGKLYTATYAAPTETGTSFSSWTALPDAETVGTPSLTVAPGDLLRIAARTSSGSVVTLGQTTTGFPAEWTQIAPSEVSTAENSFELAGNPGVVFNPADGRVTLFSRTTDGSVLAWQETAQGCGTFSEPWTIADSQGNSSALVADPVPFVFSVNNTYRWGFASYDSDFKVTLLHRSDSGTGGSGTCSAATSNGSMSAQSLRVAPSSPSTFPPPTFEKSVASAPAE